MHLRKMYIILLLDGMSCRYLLTSNWSNVSFNTTVSLLIICLDNLFIDVSGVLISPTTIVLFSTSFFMYVNVCFVYLGDPVLGAYSLTSVISSYCIDPFIII